MIKLMVMGSIHTLMARCISDTGERTNSMAGERKFGLMGLNTMETTIWAENKAKEFLNGRMDRSMRGRLRITVLMERGHINGKTEEYIQENGKKIKWKAKEFSHGLTTENMRGITEMIRRKGKANLHGLMEDGIMGAG